MVNVSKSPYPAFVTLTLVNVYIVNHYFALFYAVGYFLCSSIVVFWLWYGNHSVDTFRIIQAIALLAALIVSLYALYIIAPQYDDWTDRDSAIVTWLNQYMHGEYPYAQPTDMGNPISVFPAIPLAALPFAILGNVGLLSIAGFWLLVWLLMKTYQDYRARCTAVVLLSSAPALYMDIILRSDLIFNMALIAGFIHYLEWQECRLQTHHVTITMGILLGALLATRLALLPVFVLLWLYIVGVKPMRIRVYITIIALIAAASLILPFALWDWQTFTEYAPMGPNSQKLGENTFVQMLWILFALCCAGWGGVEVRYARQLYLYSIPVLVVIVMGTWVMFFDDTSLLQLIFTPLLFALPERVWNHEFVFTSTKAVYY